MSDVTPVATPPDRSDRRGVPLSESAPAAAQEWRGPIRVILLTAARQERHNAARPGTTDREGAAAGLGAPRPSRPGALIQPVAPHSVADRRLTWKTGP